MLLNMPRFFRMYLPAPCQLRHCKITSVSTFVIRSCSLRAVARSSDLIAFQSETSSSGIRFESVLIMPCPPRMRPLRPLMSSPISTRNAGRSFKAQELLKIEDVDPGAGLDADDPWIRGQLAHSLRLDGYLGVGGLVVQPERHASLIRERVEVVLESDLIDRGVERWIGHDGIGPRLARLGDQPEGVAGATFSRHGDHGNAAIGLRATTEMACRRSSGVRL